MAKVKALSKKFTVELGGMSWGSKDTAKLSVKAKFDTAKMDANEVQALLAAGQLHCRVDRSIGPELPLAGLPPTTVEFDATCHRVGMDLGSFSFGLSFPKSAATANTLAEFAGASAKLIVTRTSELGVGDGDEAEDKDEAEAEAGEPRIFSAGGVGRRRGMIRG
jgi:hypothetical protein